MSGVALTVLGMLAAVSFLFVVAAIREARGLGVSREALRVPDLPEDLDGTKIAFLADIHAGPLYGPARMEQLVERVNDLSADVVVLGGDYVGGRHGGADVFYPAAARFSAKYGVFAVLGNHDDWEGGDIARSRLRDSGIRLLENETVRLSVGDATLAITGLADEWTGTPDAAAAAEGLAPGDIAVLVAHNPDSFADALPALPGRWVLALAGHTHGGQVAGVYRLNPRKPTRYGRRYLQQGLTSEHGVPVIVSNGVGAVTLPLRFLARPEVHLVTLCR